MGNNFLDKPITTKKEHWEENKQFKYASCQMQGWRKNMEDAYIAYNEIPGYEDMALYGVFDGHGGGQISKYVAAHFLQVFLKRKTLPEGNIAQALTETFIQIELISKLKPGKQELLKYKSEELGRPANQSDLSSGATAVVVVITKNKFVCANAGDSRAALWQDGKCVALSIDHKPQNPIEKARIQKTGVPIVQGRVNGLNLTRSIGDFSHKNVPGLAFHQQPVTCMPEVIEVQRTGKEGLLVVGCDGIWEKYQNNSSGLLQYCLNGLKTGNSSEVLRAFFDKNISPGTNKTDPFGRDNMTAILVQFKK